MSSAKEEILGKIRRTERIESYAAISRDYHQSGSLGEEARLNLFFERLQDYEAVVYPCPRPAISEAVAYALTVRGKHGLLIPKDLPRQWLPDSFHFASGEGLSYGDIDQSEGVLTGCALAIAVTGTIVIRHSPGEGLRALTLIPDYHLCVVFGSQIVETVPEAIRKMEKFKAAPLTTISGPSATSDIEMTRVKGVHGPRALDVIVVDA